ncbi:MAG: HAD family phosphatase [Lachnospiraceae bacterium]|nr:HAD family phosphatase [Lachnospiraceae bacterium]MCR5768403.1 HAD family phosphatase [Lachnospiraceae bacterium]
MLNDIKAVIFDLDGTLVDSMWMWREIDIEYLARFGIELPDDLQKCISGMSFSETAEYFKERFKIDDDTETIKNTWNEMAWDMYAHRVGLKRGVLDFVKKLKRNGIKTGIASSNSRELVETVLDSLGIGEYFDEIHVSCEVEHGKPFPDIYLLVAEKLNTEPSKCLVFEDIMEGIEAGHAAGMKVCSVYDDFSANENERIRTASDYYIEDYTQIEV